MFYRTPIRRVHGCPHPSRSLDGHAHRISGRRRRRHRRHRYTDAAADGSVTISRATRQREPKTDGTATIAATTVAATVVVASTVVVAYAYDNRSSSPIEFSLFRPHDTNTFSRNILPSLGEPIFSRYLRVVGSFPSTTLF